jgi:hypothetical protein
MKTYKECSVGVSILGTEYILHICPSSKDKRFEELNCAGFCDESTHELFVSNLTDPKEKVSVSDSMYCIRVAIRHEMVHAFLYESGLGSDWEHKEFGHEETTVDWIARKLPAMYEAYLKIISQIESYEIDLDDSERKG